MMEAVFSKIGYQSFTTGFGLRFLRIGSVISFGLDISKL